LITQFLTAILGGGVDAQPANNTEEISIMIIGMFFIKLALFSSSH
jgi:hypothetical protein